MFFIQDLYSTIQFVKLENSMLGSGEICIHGVPGLCSP